MIDEFKVGFIIGLAVGGFCLLLSCIVLDSRWRYEAVDKGHAEYKLVGSEAVWQWKEIK